MLHGLEQRVAEARGNHRVAFCELSDAPVLNARVGAKRAETSYPFKTLTEGTLTSNGSDAPVEMPDPLYGMRMAVTRTAPDGSAMNPDECKPLQEKLVKKYSSLVTSVKKITPHKLRSTYGTNLYRATTDIYLVADVLGHTDVNTTKKHYADMADSNRRKAANAIKLRKD